MVLLVRRPLVVHIEGSPAVHLDDGGLGVKAVAVEAVVGQVAGGVVRAPNDTVVGVKRIVHVVAASACHLLLPAIAKAIIAVLEDQDAGPLGEDEAVAVAVERAAGAGRVVVAGREARASRRTRPGPCG